MLPCNVSPLFSRGESSVSRRRLLYLGLLAVFLASSPLAGAEVFTLSELEALPAERVPQEHEWRLGRKIASGDHVLRLEHVTQGSALRVGVLAHPESLFGVKGEVFVGGRSVASFLAGGGEGWLNRKVKFSNAASQAGGIHLQLVSDREFWLSPIEVVTPTQSSPNVLIFLIDTLRQDRVGAYGYDQPTTPHVDAFAKDALRFTQLIPQASWTRPSVASLMTGVYPQVHGALDRRDVMRELTTLAGTLAEGGYESHGFITNANLLPHWGLGRHFSRYVDCGAKDWSRRADIDRTVVERALKSIPFVAGRPWFFYVHAMGPHSPYANSAGMRDLFDRSKYEHHKELFYDADLAFTDRQFGKLVRNLKKNGLYGEALIVLLADHGEELWERGKMQHGKSVYDEQLRIPLLIKLPGSRNAGMVRDELVRMIDIAPTLLRVLGLPARPEFQGESFHPLLFGEDLATERVGYAATFLDRHDSQSARTRTLKYMQDRERGMAGWFDLQKDPGEKELISVPPPGGEALRAAAIRRVTEGAAGLHLFFQGNLKPGQTIAGRVEGQGIIKHELDSLWSVTSGMASEGEVLFRLSPNPKTPGFAYADLRMEVEKGALLRIGLFLDNETWPADSIFVGTASRHGALQDTEFKLSDIKGVPSALDFHSSDGQLRAFLWYLPPSEIISDEELAPDMREALEALGYIE
jgi:arylsulfatase A-like enzyme